MREQMEVIRRYHQEVKRYLRLKRTHPARGSNEEWELFSARNAVKALAWVLQVDPAVEQRGPFMPASMTSPDGRPPIQGVRLTGVW